MEALTFSQSKSEFAQRHIELKSYSHKPFFSPRRTTSKGCNQPTQAEYSEYNKLVSKERSSNVN